MTKLVERIEARRLRADDGESMRAIASRLGVSVSTVSRWVGDIQLEPHHAARLAALDPRSGGRRAGHVASMQRARERRADWQAEGRALARRGDPLHRTGCMLHWAEGSKARCNVIFSNSDVDMMRLFVRFLRECYGAANEALAFSVNCFTNNGLSLSEIESYWLDALALPPSSLRKAAVNRASSASQRKGRILLYGTGRITLHSTRVAQSIYGAIQEYGGFDRPEWLD